MRALLVGVILLAAGCVVPGTDIQPAGVLDATKLEIPSGAKLVEEGGKTILRFAEVTLPFKSTFKIPEGATIVRAVTKVGAGIPVGASMVNEQSGRRRCNNDVLDAWDLRITGLAQCSGLAAIDPPGASWVVMGTGATGTVATFDVVIETTPLDGIVAQLDLSKLSMPSHSLQPTTYSTVKSFDGVGLWVEVTLPEGEGPWPTVVASSPYNGHTARGVKPAMWEYFTQDWAQRGYAVVNADVRGYGMSGGCVEVWSINEQKDQAFLVDWVAEQPWSDGKVGFYGQSYVATTPVAAAVQKPAALKAIIAVAPVINPYYDWHYGGVPNGESTGSPIAYQTQDPTTAVFATDLAALMMAGNGVCDPTLIVEANDPRFTYGAFYEERNFSKRAGDITAAVLYTQGFEDSNVKSRMIPDWFNAITAPKLGLFGHWVHQHPTRADEEILFLGWMDEHVKGKDLGFAKVANTHVVVDDETYRTANAWPPTDAVDVALQADFGKGTLASEASGPDAQLLLASDAPAGPTALTLKYPIENDIAVAGMMRLSVQGMLLPAGNAYVYARVYDDNALFGYGAFNLAHRNGHDKFDLAAPGEKTSFTMEFLPTEHVFRAGHTLKLVLTGVGSQEFGAESISPPFAYTFSSGQATTLILPTIPLSEYTATPATALR